MSIPCKLRGTDYGIQRVAICPLHQWRTLHALCESHDMPPVHDFVVVEVSTYSSDEVPVAYPVNRSNGNYLVYRTYSGAYSWIVRNA